MSPIAATRQSRDPERVLHADAVFAPDPPAPYSREPVALTARPSVGLVARLKAGQRSQATLHREVHRPWGSYDSVDTGHNFQVKRIKVKPGAALSLQSHVHRAEHWIVVRGTARVTRDDEVFELQANQSTFIPLGAKHRLENPGAEVLELIEVQSGDYLGEDDIVRYEDVYGRS